MFGPFNDSINILKASQSHTKMALNIMIYLLIMYKYTPTIQK